MKKEIIYKAAVGASFSDSKAEEIGKRLNTTGDTLLKSRSVIKFDMTEISASLATYGKTVNDCKFILNLYTSHAKNLPSSLEPLGITILQKSCFTPNPCTST